MSLQLLWPHKITSIMISTVIFTVTIVYPSAIFHAVTIRSWCMNINCVFVTDLVWHSHLMPECLGHWFLNVMLVPLDVSHESKIIHNLISAVTLPRRTTCHKPRCVLSVRLLGVVALQWPNCLNKWAGPRRGWKVVAGMTAGHTIRC